MDGDDDASQSPDGGDDATVRQLQGFGFGREAVVGALAAHRGDADQALLSLMGDEGGAHGGHLREVLLGEGLVSRLLVAERAKQKTNKKHQKKARKGRPHAPTQKQQDTRIYLGKPSKGGYARPTTGVFLNTPVVDASTN